MRVATGEAAASVMVDKGALAIIFVRVGWVCMVIATIVPTWSWSTVGVGEPALPGRLHAERVVTSERDINRYLNVFNFSFMIVMVGRQPNRKQNTPRLHPSTGECSSSPLGGQPLILPPISFDRFLRMVFAGLFLFLLFQLEIGNA